MSTQSSRWGLIAVILIGGGVTGLGLSNPELHEYQRAVLMPVAQERHSAADAMLTSILQSIPTPGSSNGTPAQAPSVLTVLTDRTKRANFVMFSVYTTEFDYCEGNSAVRTVGRSVGIAGRFYTLDKGKCRSEHNG